MELQRQRKNQVVDYCPFVYSLLLHSIVLLAMGLMFSKPERKINPIIIDISLAAKEEQLDTAPLQVLKTESFSSPKSSSVQDFSSQILNDTESISIDAPSIIPVSSSPRITTDLDLNLGKGLPKIGKSNGKDDNQSGLGNGNGVGFDRAITDGIDQRIEDNGAGTGDVQFSITWDNYNDIDIWVKLHDGKTHGTISWMNREFANGFLDIDRNVKPETNKAIENIFWNTNEAPYCGYTVYIHKYKQWDDASITTVYLRAKIDDKVVYKKFSIRARDGLVRAYSFIRKPSKDQKIKALKDIPYTISHKESEKEKTQLRNPIDDIVIQPVPTFQ